MAKLKLSFEEIENEINVAEMEKSLSTPAGEDSQLVDELEAQPSDLPTEEADEDDLVGAAEALEAFCISFENEFIEGERVADTVETLIDLEDKIKSDEIKDGAAIDMVAEMATAGTDVEGSTFISTESFSTNKSIALEGIGQRIGAAISNIVAGAIESAKAMLAGLRNFYTFINLQKTLLKNLKTSLSKVKTKSVKATFSIKANRYMVSGVDLKTPTNKDEYFSSFRKNSVAFAEINTAAINFTKSQFLAKTKMFLSMTVPGVGYDKNFFNLYSALNSELLLPLSKIHGLKVFKSEEGFKEYISEPYLGGYILTVRIPDVEAPKSKEDLSTTIKNLISVVPKATASFTNTGNTNMFVNYGKVEFADVTVTDIEKLIADTEKLALEMDKHISFVVKWVSTFASGSVYSKLQQPLVGIALTQYFAGVRIVRLGSYIVHNLMNRIFQANKNVISNNIRIANAAIAEFHEQDGAAA